MVGVWEVVGRRLGETGNGLAICSLVVVVGAIDCVHGSDL